MQHCVVVWPASFVYCSIDVIVTFMTVGEGPSLPEEPDFSPEAILEQIEKAPKDGDFPWTNFEQNNPEAAYRLSILMTPEEVDSHRRMRKQLKYYNRQAIKPVKGFSALLTSAGLWSTYAAIEGSEIVEKPKAGAVIFGLVSVAGLFGCVKDIKAWPQRKLRAMQERNYYQQYFGNSGDESKT